MKIVVGIPNLNVYSQKEINSHISKLPMASNIIDAQFAGIPNENEIIDLIYKSVPYKSYVFNQNNELLCYSGSSSCTITELSDLRNKKISENYSYCDKEDENLLDTTSFNEFINQFKLSNNLNFKDYKYKIIVFMNWDLAKGEIIEDWNYIFGSFYNENEKDIVFIRIWSDLNENWGLNPNKKAKFKNRKVKGSSKEYMLTLESLPYQK
jgi:hypothetical protein